MPGSGLFVDTQEPQRVQGIRLLSQQILEGQQLLDLAISSMHAIQDSTAAALANPVKRFLETRFRLQVSAFLQRRVLSKTHCVNNKG